MNRTDRDLGKHRTRVLSTERATNRCGRVASVTLCTGGTQLARPVRSDSPRTGHGHGACWSASARTGPARL